MQSMNVNTTSMMNYAPRYLPIIHKDITVVTNNKLIIYLWKCITKLSHKWTDKRRIHWVWLTCLFPVTSMCWQVLFSIWHSIAFLQRTDLLHALRAREVDICIALVSRYCDQTSKCVFVVSYVVLYYRIKFNIRRTLVGNKVVDHSDVVGASPVGAAPTTFSFSTWHLASRDSAKTATRQYEKLWSVVVWCVLYYRLDGMLPVIYREPPHLYWQPHHYCYYVSKPLHGFRVNLWKEKPFSMAKNGIDNGIIPRENTPRCGRCVLNLNEE